jgi:hypothetical protein
MEVSQPGRDAANSRFVRQVREQAEARGETLTDAEVARRAKHLRSAHFTRLQLLSAQARRRNNGNKPSTATGDF